RSPTGLSSSPIASPLVPSSPVGEREGEGAASESPRGPSTPFAQSAQAAHASAAAAHAQAQQLALILDALEAERARALAETQALGGVAASEGKRSAASWPSSAKGSASASRLRQPTAYEVPRATVSAVGPSSPAPVPALPIMPAVYAIIPAAG